MRVRTLAATALAVLAAPAVTTRAADLRARLLGTDAVDAYAATLEAGRQKDAALALALVEAGTSTPYPHLAVACGDALAAIGPAAVEATGVRAAVDRAKKAKDPKGLAHLARLLGAWGDPWVDEPLGWLASSRRAPEVAAEGLYAVGDLPVSRERPFPACVAAVLDGLDAKSPTVQMAAASAAGRLRIEEGTERLVTTVRQSQHGYAGLYAVQALRLMGRRVPVATFARVVESDAKRETMQACLKAITDLSGPEDVEDLLTLTRSTKTDVRDAACLALGLVVERAAPPPPDPRVVTPTDGAPAPAPAAPVDPRVVDRMLQIVETDVAWEVRDAARQTLLRIGDRAREAVAARVGRWVDASERDVALTAIELCGTFRVESAHKDLLKVATLDKDPVRRMFAARAAGDASPALAAQELLAAASRDRKGRDSTIAAIRALGYVRDEAAYKGLVAIATGGPETSEKVLAEAERSLERLTGRRFGRSAERWDAWYARAKDHDPFQRHLPRVDRKHHREEVVGQRKFGLTETTERAVENGLRWLELQQHPEGLWDGADRGFGGVTNCLPAYTGLALLALLGAGYQTGQGKYRESIRRGAEFLSATQFYDGGFPVTGGGDDSWIFAYLISMGVWGITEAYALSGEPGLRGPAERGVGYLVRVQAPGEGWRYGPRNQSDSSCTAWVLMTLKTASLVGLPVAQRSIDGVDYWLERCQTDMTGEVERPEDLATDYDKEVGVKRQFKAITGYFVLSGTESSSLQQTSMTAVGMVSRFFLGWNRSHPFLIGSANYLMDYLPQWRRGLEKGQAIAWYFYFWYYGTLAMHQMGGRYWRAWNEKIKTMLPANQRVDPPAAAGSWDPDTALLNGGRLFSTCLAIMTLETYYRFSPLVVAEPPRTPPKPGAAPPAMGEPEPAMDEPAMGG